jgi:hypothetical protein
VLAVLAVLPLLLLHAARVNARATAVVVVRGLIASFAAARDHWLARRAG